MTENIPGFDLPSIIAAILRVLIVLSETDATSSNPPSLIAGTMKILVLIVCGHGVL
jgi:hypothetical protein